MIESILIFVVTTIFTLWTALIDAEHFSRKQYFEDHESRFMQRTMFVMLIFLYNFNLGLAAALLFWVVFDQSLNIMRGKPLFYIGTTAKTDIFFSKRKWLYITTKISALIISLILFFI